MTGERKDCLRQAKQHKERWDSYKPPATSSSNMARIAGHAYNYSKDSNQTHSLLLPHNCCCELRWERDDQRVGSRLRKPKVQYSIRARVEGRPRFNFVWHCSTIWMNYYPYASDMRKEKDKTSGGTSPIERHNMTCWRGHDMHTGMDFIELPSNSETNMMWNNPM